MRILCNSSGVIWCDCSEELAFGCTSSCSIPSSPRTLDACAPFSASKKSSPRSKKMRRSLVPTTSVGSSRLPTRVRGQSERQRADSRTIDVLPVRGDVQQLRYWLPAIVLVGAFKRELELLPWWFVHG